MDKATPQTDPVSPAPELAEEAQPEWQESYLTELRLRRACIPARFRNKGLENFKVERNRRRKAILETANSFIAAFNTRNGSPDGLLISGPVGSGKTHIAVAILQAVIRKGHTGLYYNLPDLLTDIRSTYGDSADLSESQLLDEIQQPDLLLLDDLGAEKTKDWVLDRLYLIINRRYESGRTLLVTTNLDLGELTQKLGERIVSRLCEMCHSFPEFPDEDFRKKHMQ